MKLVLRNAFVRVPVSLLDALLRVHLSAVQLRIVLWVIRHTHGWNRSQTRFSWYGIAQDLQTNRGTVFRAGARLLKADVLRRDSEGLGIQPVSAWKSLKHSGAPGQRWITPPGTSHTPLLHGNETVAIEQRFSVERKTDVKTKRQRRRRGGYVYSPKDDALSELLNFYGALTGKVLSTDERRRFSHSAKALLDGCSGDLQEAKGFLENLSRAPDAQKIALNGPELS